MIEILAFACGAALSWAWLKFKSAEPMSDEELWEHATLVDWQGFTYEEQIEDLLKRVYDLEAENRDLRVEIEIKRKKLEDAGL